MISLEVSSRVAGSSPAWAPVANQRNVRLDNLGTAPAIQLGPHLCCLVAVAAGWAVAGETTAPVAVVH